MIWCSKARFAWSFSSVAGLLRRGRIATDFLRVTTYQLARFGHIDRSSTSVC